ncbi:hypothetical protein DFP85_103220 [Halomonas ventosae]|uniref:Lipoprotein n=1 Tax=Halomonas ventosae TaxID=229007 RepID=A0A4R6ZV12_9GAMM|nr:hypothetical protein [Halomonas ventosae]TDR56701.1 hypothetical protein DFP85_103220 [Halomonas ventosae]
MRIPVRPLMIALMASTLALAGCSYTPARIKSEPLVEIDGYGSHRHYRGDDRHYRDRDDRWRHYEDRHYRDRRYRDRDRYHHAERRHDDYRRGGFCPPGLRMQGRC